MLKVAAPFFSVLLLACESHSAPLFPDKGAETHGQVQAVPGIVSDIQLHPGFAFCLSVCLVQETCMTSSTRTFCELPAVSF